jgi:hypothetical protein
MAKTHRRKTRRRKTHRRKTHLRKTHRRKTHLRKTQMKRLTKRRNPKIKRTQRGRRYKKMKGGDIFEDIASIFKYDEAMLTPLEVKIDWSELLKLFVGKKTGKIVMLKSKFKSIISSGNEMLPDIIKSIMIYIPGVNFNDTGVVVGFTHDNVHNIMFNKSTKTLYLSGIPLKLTNSGTVGGSTQYTVFTQYIDISDLVSTLYSGLEEVTRDVSLPLQGGADPQDDPQEETQGRARRWVSKLTTGIKNKMGSAAKKVVKKSLNFLGKDETKVLYKVMVKMLGQLMGFVVTGMVKLSLIVVENDDGTISLMIEREGGGIVCPPDVQCLEKEKCEDKGNDKHTTVIASGIHPLTVINDQIGKAEPEVEGGVEEGTVQAEAEGVPPLPPPLPELSDVGGYKKRVAKPNRQPKPNSYSKSNASFAQSNDGPLVQTSALDVGSVGPQMDPLDYATEQARIAQQSAASFESKKIGGIKQKLTPSNPFKSKKIK